MTNAVIQVDDDLDLLDQMMRDAKSADAKYQPTHFWKFYEDRFLPELREQGLHSFRRRSGSVLATFGGTDPIPNPPRSWRRGLVRRAGLVNASVASALGSFLLPSPSDITRARHRRVKRKFRDIKADLNEVSTTLVGDPEGVTFIDGKPWTATHLEYCSVFADAKKNIHFDGVGPIVEIGSGLGRNAEIWAALYPEATILVFDIPPQLYVANQYLLKRFGNRVIPYREACQIDPNYSHQAYGKIVIQPTWRFPDWAIPSGGSGIFWNSASFQEMEPDVVLNYLSLVKKMQLDNVYINAMPGGNYHPGKADAGELGTKKPVLERYYYEALEPDYQAVTVYDTDHLDCGEYGHHRSYVFRRKQRLVR